MGQVFGPNPSASRYHQLIEMADDVLQQIVAKPGYHLGEHGLWANTGRLACRRTVKAQHPLFLRQQLRKHQSLRSPIKIGCLK